MTDLYPSLDSLKAAMCLGRDYRIRVWRGKWFGPAYDTSTGNSSSSRRKSIVTIISPHGGFMELGTSAIARAVAGSDYNLFDFQGLLAYDPFRLHVTSHIFSDPQLTRLLSSTLFAVSIHGMPDSPSPKEIWLGGLNRILKENIRVSLEAHGFTCNSKPPKFKGEHPCNVVNLPYARGVQIELPFSLRRQMFHDSNKLFCRTGRTPKTTPLFQSFVRAVRMAVAEYAKSNTI
jgi:phage replication-related protein YjqB (UPF0714/DUF867 family)